MVAIFCSFGTNTALMCPLFLGIADANYESAHHQGVSKLTKSQH